MTFMKKFLDLLNMDNWGRNSKENHIVQEPLPKDMLPNNEQAVTEEEIIESSKKQYYVIDQTESEEKTTVKAKSFHKVPVKDNSLMLYHDKFGEEYREINNYRDITFNGRNFDIPEVKLCAAILLSGNQNGSKIRSNDHYSLYFEGRYGIMNISTLHKWLYEKGYFRKANFQEAINLYKVAELKTILESIGLKKTGKKADLIKRIETNIDDDLKSLIVSKCDRLFVTEKGIAFLEENGDYYMWHKKSYGVTFEEFNKHRILQGRKRTFYDTIFQALSEKAYIYQIKHYFSKLEIIYYNLSEVCYDQAVNGRNNKEKMYSLSLEHSLNRLYFSTNLASKYYLFSIENVKFDGVETAKNRILEEEVFNPYTISRILDLRPYFREQLLDVVYATEILPYCLFDKYDMLDAILDLYDGNFNAEHYTNYIRMNYGKYIKKIVK